MLKKFYYFAAICCWFVGVIGGFGYAAYNRAGFIAFCVLALGAMAFPYVRECFRKMMNG